MKVKVEIVIETSDFGKKEFKREIEKLISDIDLTSKLLSFDMYKIQTSNTTPKRNDNKQNLGDAK